LRDASMQTVSDTQGFWRSSVSPLCPFTLSILWCWGSSWPLCSFHWTNHHKTDKYCKMSVRKCELKRILKM
jgi:hypothetical protein